MDCLSQKRGEKETQPVMSVDPRKKNSVINLSWDIKNKNRGHINISQCYFLLPDFYILLGTDFESSS